jgi:hypothetical protein
MHWLVVYYPLLQGIDVRRHEEEGSEESINESYSTNNALICALRESYLPFTVWRSGATVTRAEKASSVSLSCARTEQGYSSQAMMKKRAILLGTIADVFPDTSRKSVSLFELHRNVGETAAELGAKGELLATLLRRLPTLLFEVHAADPAACRASVSLSSRPQYEIWAEGVPPRVVDDISQYESKRDKYLLWLDISHDDHRSLGIRREHLKSHALRLFLFLVENMGVGVKRRDVYVGAFNERPEDKEDWRNLLSQYVGQVDDFTGERFRELYLIRDEVHDAFLLRESFRDEYFAFLTLRASRAETGH